MRITITLLIVIVAGIILGSCSQTYNDLSRVDVQVTKEEMDGETIVIQDKAHLEALKEVLIQVRWQPNTEAKMTRKEDAAATLFFQQDQDMPEKLVEHKIWWQKGNQSAIIISNHKEEGYGELDKKYTKEFKQLLLNRK